MSNNIVSFVSYKEKINKKKNVPTKFVPTPNSLIEECKKFMNKNSQTSDFVQVGS